MQREMTRSLLQRDFVTKIEVTQRRCYMESRCMIKEEGIIYLTKVNDEKKKLNAEKSR